jgi:hypothetical protein
LRCPCDALPGNNPPLFLLVRLVNLMVAQTPPFSIGLSEAPERSNPEQWEA